MEQLRIRVLGSWQIEYDGQPVVEGLPEKARALLAYLAVERDRGHHRDELSELLYPDRQPGSARANLRHTLSDLRHAFSSLNPPLPVLLAGRETIQIHPDISLWIDAAAFEAAIQSGESPSGIDPAALEEAAGLYRGDFLHGFNVRGCAHFEEWVLIQREHFHSLAVEARYRLANYYEAIYAPVQALPHAWQHVRLEPWDERAARQVMRLLAANGQPNAAIAHYQAFRNTLLQELGVEPEAETRAVYTAIQDRSAPAAPGTPPTHNLPAGAVPLVGRETELSEVLALARSTRCRMITITGPGGCGKSRLALEAGFRLMGLFEHGIWLVSLAPVKTPDAIFPAVASSLNLSFQPAADPAVQLLNYLRNKNILLILDNFEHLLEGSRLVSRLLASAPGLKVLVTSRSSLGLQAEQIYTLQGLPYPPSSAADQAAEWDAVQLFIQAAQRCRRDFELTGENVLEIAHICRLLQGLPLALLLAAAQVDRFSPGQLALWLSDHLNHLAAKWTDVDPMQGSIRAVFIRSWKTLTRRERDSFRRLAVLQGSFTVETAWQVCGRDREELIALAAKSMLQPVQLDRYEHIEILRQFGLEKLAKYPALERSVRDRHCAWFAGCLAEWGLALHGPHQLETLNEMRLDFDNWQAAWSWALKVDHLAFFDQALNGVCLYFDWYGRSDEAMALLAALSSAGHEPVSPTRLNLQARAAAWQAHFLQKSGHLHKALQSACSALDITNTLFIRGEDDPEVLAFVLQQMAGAAMHTDMSEAIRLGEESLALYRRLDNRMGIAGVMEMQGAMAGWSGSYLRALTCYEEALALRRAAGDLRGQARTLGAMSFILIQLGHFPEGEQCIREGIAIRRDLADWPGTADELFNLGMALNWIGRFEEAQSLAEQALASHGEMLGSVEAARFYSLWASTLVMQGNYEQAEYLAHESRSLAQSSGSVREAGIAAWILGLVHVAWQNYEEAFRWLDQSLAQLESAGVKDVLFAATATCGYAAFGLGRIKPARDFFTSAFHQVAHQNLVNLAALALPGIALLLIQAGHLERALEISALAKRSPAVARARWFADVTCAHLAQAEAALPPEKAAAALERGQSLALETICREMLLLWTEIAK